MGNMAQLLHNIIVTNWKTVLLFIQKLKSDIIIFHLYILKQKKRR
jgi:hypothetical protein